MSLIEFIGFIITFAAMIFLMAKKANDERRRRADPEGYEREQQKKARAQERLYREILGEPPTRPKKKPKAEDDEDIEVPVYHAPIKMPPKPLVKQVKAQKKRHSIDKKNLVISYTIFGPPKALKNDKTKLFND